MQKVVLTIPKTSDKSLINLFRDIGEKFSHSTGTLVGPINSNFPNVNFSNEKDETLKIFNKESGYLIEQIHLNIAGLVVIYCRGGCDKQNSPVYDYIEVRDNTSSASNEDKIDVVSFISSKINIVTPEKLSTSVLTQEQNDILAIHNSTLERLERLNEELIEKSSNFRENLQNQFNTKQQELEKEVADQKKSLLEKSERLQNDYNELGEELQQRKKEIDDRDNTHARRAIRDKMLGDVTSRVKDFGVSSKTENKRRPVKYAIFTLVMLLILSLLYTVVEINDLEKYTVANDVTNAIKDALLNQEDNRSRISLSISIEPKDSIALYWLWTRLLIISFGIFGTILYYIKWQNSWAEQHSSAEFQLQQFHLDVNRANWIVETGLEWRKETGSVIPKELISSITKNLFEKDKQSENIIHPADELASALFGTATRVKLKSNENEVEINPKKIKKSKIASTVEE